jgi:hypothetical protein
VGLGAAAYPGLPAADAIQADRRNLIRAGRGRERTGPER